ncbi:MAG: hypothetical protein OEW21_06970 [Betaproteobacteria bacterium]|nr:hypothetical protein [Betaproteobacteria bacterium]
MHSKNSLIFLSLVAAALTAPGAAQAQGFALHVSPPRFELKTKPGEKLREAIQVTNPSFVLGRYAAHTADWTLSELGTLQFSEGDPAAGSCRPWVRIERRQFTVPANATRAYRFEVLVPDSAPAGECRFALMLGSDPAAEQGVRIGQASFPVGGQIGVIVYVAVGGAQPKLVFKGLRKETVDSAVLPVAVIENTGNAHGRPEGVLRATDASGREFEMTVSEIPILAGQTRSVPINLVNADGKTAGKFTFPLKLKGTIEWDGGKQDIDETVR